MTKKQLHKSAREVRAFSKSCPPLEQGIPSSSGSEAPLKWTKTKPTVPGWYWCHNAKDWRGDWEAVVRIEKLWRPSGYTLYCCWLISPFESRMMSENEWSEHALWAGPLSPPNDGDKR